jgi:hypothetical protein
VRSASYLEPGSTTTRGSQGLPSGIECDRGIGNVETAETAFTLRVMTASDEG